MFKGIITSIIFILIFCSVSAQKKTSNFTYTDSFGNDITIYKFKSLPSKLDITFFKSNLTGFYFDDKLNEKSFRYTYYISDIVKKEKDRFEFALSIISKSKDPEELMKYPPLRRFYSMKVKEVNGKWQIDTIKFLYAEI